MLLRLRAPDEWKPRNKERRQLPIIFLSSLPWPGKSYSKDLVSRSVGNWSNRIISSPTSAADIIFVSLCFFFSTSVKGSCLSWNRLAFISGTMFLPNYPEVTTHQSFAHLYNLKARARKIEKQRCRWLPIALNSKVNPNSSKLTNELGKGGIG